MKTLTCHVAARPSPLVRKAVQLLGRYLAERHDSRLKESGPGADLTLDIQPGIGTEGFRIEPVRDTSVRLTGNDERGLIYAVGKYLRDPRWRGTSVPEKHIRGIYFASHFHNFYHDAPVEDVQRYVEELALWGCNLLMVWFDMHHYTGIDDPAAKAMIRRLHDILQAAQDCGVGLWLGGLANESYCTSPPELRADWTAGHDGYTAEPCGHYHVEICPNKPGGLELILQYRRSMLEAFRDLNIAFFTIWPYDQGGCTCAQCAPWGANGFLKTGAAVARLVREIFPKVNIVLSTWYFDKFTAGEWAGLDRAFARKPDWVDYLLADNHGSFPEYPLQHGIPANLPAIGFPEISMMLMWPWGAFGANPRTAYWQEYWNGVRARLEGGGPYSEGIYEDINKVLLLQLYWNGDRSTKDIAREYAAGEFSAECADDIVSLMESLEATLDHSMNHGGALAVLQGGGWEHFADRLPQVYFLPRVRNPETYAALARSIDARLAPAARASWRWRLLFIRAALDEELHASKGRPTAKSDALFDELTAIFHADAAEWLVSPISRKTITRVKDQLTPPARLPELPPSRKHSKLVLTWQVSKLIPKSVAAAPAVRLSDPLQWQTLSDFANMPGFINVHSLTGNDDGIAYIGGKFRVSKAGQWILHIGHDGGIRAFVNGRAVLTVPERTNPAPRFRSKARIALAKGINEIVIALDTAAGYGWGIYCCFETIGKPGRRPVFPVSVPP